GCAGAAVLERGVLAQDVPFAFERLLDPRLGELEGFLHRDAAVPVAIGPLPRERLDEVRGKPRLVALAVRARRGDDDAAGTGASLHEFAARARGVDEDDARRS